MSNSDVISLAKGSKEGYGVNKEYDTKQNRPKYPVELYMKIDSFR